MSQILFSIKVFFLKKLPKYFIQISEKHNIIFLNGTISLFNELLKQLYEASKLKQKNALRLFIYLKQKLILSI